MLFPRKETKLSALRKIFKVKKDGKMLLNLKFRDKQNACLNCCLSKNTNASDTCKRKTKGKYIVGRTASNKVNSVNQVKH